MIWEDVLEVSDTLIVADPCYVPNSLRSGLSAELEVKPGRWLADIERNAEGRVEAMQLRRIGSHAPIDEFVGTLGVDSGQMMMLSGDAEWQDEQFTLDTTERGDAMLRANAEHIGRLSYNGACLITLSSGAGTLSRKAFVSESGWGDGSYPCSVGRNHDEEIVAVKVVFIWEDDDQDEEDD